MAPLVASEGHTMRALISNFAWTRARHYFLICAAAATAAPGVDAMDTPLLTLAKATRPAREVPMFGTPTTIPAYEYAEIMVTNIFEEPIELTARVGPQRAFVPIVKRATGEVVSSGENFGVTASVVAKEQSLLVPPGMVKTISIYPWETVPREERIPGTYYLRVQLRYRDKLWESNEIEIKYK